MFDDGFELVDDVVAAAVAAVEAAVDDGAFGPEPNDKKGLLAFFS